MRSVSQPVESDPSEGSFADTKLESENKREIDVDVQRKEVGVQVNMDDESLGVDQTKDSRIGENEPSTWSTATWKGATWGKATKKKVRGLKGSTKREVGNSGAGPNSGIGKPQCLRCGRLHKGVCLAGTIGCYRCGQKGHMIRECRMMPWMVRSQRTFSGRKGQQGIAPSDPVMPGMLFLRVLISVLFYGS